MQIAPSSDRTHARTQAGRQRVCASAVTIGAAGVGTHPATTSHACIHARVRVRACVRRRGWSWRRRRGADGARRRFYFAYCEAAFDAGYIHDLQVVWVKGGAPPRGRAPRLGQRRVGGRQGGAPNPAPAGGGAPGSPRCRSPHPGGPPRSPARLCGSFQYEACTAKNSSTERQWQASQHAFLSSCGPWLDIMVRTSEVVIN